MVLDRRKAREIGQALMRAGNKKDGDNILENVTQTSTAFGDGSYDGSMFGGMGFPSASQTGATIGNKAARQSHRLIPTPRLHPFRGPARLSDTGEVADLAKAHGVPAQDQLAFNEAPRTSSRLANPRTIYDRPLAINAAGALQQRYWDYLWEGLFPSYCQPTDDNPTFPPLVNQVDEGDKAACHKQFEHDQEQCYENYNYDPRALDRCFGRAVTIRDLCLRGEREISPWNDVDEDGVRLPKPRKR